MWRGKWSDVRGKLRRRPLVRRVVHTSSGRPRILRWPAAGSDFESIPNGWRQRAPNRPSRPPWPARSPRRPPYRRSRTPRQVQKCRSGLLARRGWAAARILGGARRRNKLLAAAGSDEALAVDAPWFDGRWIPGAADPSPPATAHPRLSQDVRVSTTSCPKRGGGHRCRGQVKQPNENPWRWWDEGSHTRRPLPPPPKT